MGVLPIERRAAPFAGAFGRRERPPARPRRAPAHSPQHRPRDRDHPPRRRTEEGPDGGLPALGPPGRGHSRDASAPDRQARRDRDRKGNRRARNGTPQARAPLGERSAASPSGGARSGRRRQEVRRRPPHAHRRGARRPERSDRSLESRDGDHHRRGSSRPVRATITTSPPSTCAWATPS